MSDSAPAIVVGEFARNDREIVRVMLDTYRGHRILQIRNFYSASDGTWKPGKGGIGMAVRHLPRLAKAINTALAEAARSGIIQPEVGSSGDD
jgi:hypothetical protein